MNADASDSPGRPTEAPTLPFSTQAPRRLLSRRAALRHGVMASAGVLLAPRAEWTVQAAAAPPRTLPSAKAKSVIQIWMWGGPPHLDTFDPKPGAGPDYCGPLDKPIPTVTAGLRIGELLPQLAKQSDKYSVIRSMTHGINAHETASYVVQTGRPAGERVVYPSVGAVVSLFKGYDAGYQGLIPPYIVLTELQGRFSETGFLGPRQKPFATGGDPRQPRFVVEGVVAPGISDQRQQDRRKLLEALNTLEHALPADPQLQAAHQAEQQAYDLILGDAGKVFDLAQEPTPLRERYGLTTFGQSCLMARRLVERGVPYITINYKGWDTHKQHFQAMRRMLPDLDRGLATLLQDLHDRGLLERTIVWWSGEFGRTPRVQNEAPWYGGRNHCGQVFSALLAGGGFKGGHVVGASDEHGEEVQDRPVYPWDLIGSLYAQLGINGRAKLPHPLGLPTYALPTAEDALPSGGLLKEIM